MFQKPSIAQSCMHDCHRALENHVFLKKMMWEWYRHNSKMVQTQQQNSRLLFGGLISLLRHIYIYRSCVCLQHVYMCKCMTPYHDEGTHRERGGGGERERGRGSEREREREEGGGRWEVDKQADRERGGERDRKTDSKRQRERERERERERDRQTDRQTEASLYNCCLTVDILQREIKLCYRQIY